MRDSVQKHGTSGDGKRAAAVVDEIGKDIDSGLGIVPVLGSGISAQSGIPAGNDYRAYLFYCVARLFGSDGAGKSTEAWDPSQLKWPPYTAVPTYDDLSKRIRAWTQERAVTLRKLSPQALWESLGAVADWRAMLHLLSRARAEAGEAPVLLKEPDPRIIDSFFVNLTEGKRPNTAHMLLAHLADVLRIRVILTTNFDTLLETAFARLEMPIATFDVHYQAGLPDGRFTRAQRSIVKINGGRYGLRADFTLDTLPDARDSESFLSYLAPLAPSRVPPSATNVRGIGVAHQRNILVMGVSGQERRTISLICNAMLELPELKTYWVCHRRSEVDRISRAFSEVSATLRARRRSPPPRPADELHRDVAITATPDIGLFLLHLYQRIFLCLPPSGVPFKAVWPQPPPPYELARPDSRGCQNRKASAMLAKGVERLTRVINTDRRLVFVTGRSGVPSVAAHVFSEIDDTRHRVWVDVEDDSTEGDLAISVLEALRHQVGVAEPMFFHHQPEHPPAFAEQFERLRRFSRRPFLVFINARESPGRDPRRRAAVEALVHLLNCLEGQETVTTVLLGWDRGCWKAILKGRRPARVKLDPLLTHPRGGTAASVLKRIQRLRGADKNRFIHFVAALTLFRKPCYLSATNAWPFLPLSTDRAGPTNGGFVDKDEMRASHVRDCLKRLRKLGAIRDDSGQSVYMHRTVRDKIRRRLEDHLKPGWMIEANQGIADWYLKLFRASGDVAAAFESLHHRISCIKAARGLASQKGSRHTSEYLAESAGMEAYVTLAALGPFLRSAPQPETWLVRLQNECDRLRRYGGTLRHVELAVAEARRRQTEIRAQWQCPRGSGAAHLCDQPSAARVASTSARPNVPALPNLSTLTTFPEIQHLTRNRQYRDAEFAISRELTRLRISPTAIAPDASHARLVRYDKCRSSARAWVTQTQFAQTKIGEAVRLLHRFHSLRLLQADLHFRLGAEKTKMRQALMGAEAIYVFATELMRNIADIRFLRSENAFFRANQALILSWMNRPREAHRRYNEAYGYLNQLETLPMSLRFAEIDGRRTETFLWNLRTLSKGKPGRMRRNQVQGLLRDAIAAAERAAYKSYDLHYPAWHSYLAELAMDVCCEIARQGPSAEERYARSRDRSGYGEWFRSSFESGYSSVGQDPVRLRRYIELANCFRSHVNAMRRPDYVKKSPLNQAHVYAVNRPGHVDRDCLKEINELRRKCENRLGQIDTSALDDDIRAYVVRQPRRSK